MVGGVHIAVALAAIALGLPAGMVQLAAALGAVATLGLLFALARRGLFTRDAMESEQATSGVLLYFINGGMHYTGQSGISLTAPMPELSRIEEVITRSSAAAAPA